MAPQGAVSILHEMIRRGRAVRIIPHGATFDVTQAGVTSTVMLSVSSHTLLPNRALFSASMPRCGQYPPPVPAGCIAFGKGTSSSDMLGVCPLPSILRVVGSPCAGQDRWPSRHRRNGRDFHGRSRRVSQGFLCDADPGKRETGHHVRQQPRNRTRNGCI